MHPASASLSPCALVCRGFRSPSARVKFKGHCGRSGYRCIHAQQTARDAGESALRNGSLQAQLIAFKRHRPWRFEDGGETLRADAEISFELGTKMSLTGKSQFRSRGLSGISSRNRLLSKPALEIHKPPFRTFLELGGKKSLQGTKRARTKRGHPPRLKIALLGQLFPVRDAQ